MRAEKHTPGRPRPLGSLVRVAERGERFRGTRGVVCAHVQAFGTTLYRVATSRLVEFEIERQVEGWECLFFPDQLRTIAKSTDRATRGADTTGAAP